MLNVPFGVTHDDEVVLRVRGIVHGNHVVEPGVPLVAAVHGEGIFRRVGKRIDQAVALQADHQRAGIAGADRIDGGGVLWRRADQRGRDVVVRRHQSRRPQRRVEVRRR